MEYKYYKEVTGELVRVHIEQDTTPENPRYNGFQAPFLVCLWNNSFEELELLLKDTSEKLYKAYKKELEWDMTYERLDTNFHSMDKALAEFYLAGIR